MSDLIPPPPIETPPAAPTFSAATQPSYVRIVFLGPDSLRPGWGLAFFVLTFLALQNLAVRIAYSRDFGSSGLWSMLVEETGVFLAAVVPTLILAQAERRPWGSYGLPLRQLWGERSWVRLFCIGALWGFAGITLLIVSLRGLHVFDFGHLALHGARIARFAAFWAVMFLTVGFAEEFLFRGYVQFTLTRGIGFWPAALILSAAFGLIHLRNGDEQWPGILAAATIGFFFCFTLRRTGSLWFAVGFHAAWDWGETFFYSVPDSGMVSPGHLLSSKLHGSPWLTGGSVGPEGSALCFAVIGVVWLAFSRVYRVGRTPSPATS